MNPRLRRIIDRYTQAKDAGDLAFGAAQEVVAELHALPPAVRAEAQQFYGEIGEDLLERNISLTNYDLKAFSESIRERKKKSSITKLTPGAHVEDPLNELAEHLPCFASCLESVVPNLRRYVVLHFGNNDADEVAYLVLHDEYSKFALFDTIRTKLHPNCHVMEVSHFLTDLPTSKDLQSKDFYCLLVLSPHPGQTEVVPHFIDQIAASYDSVEQLVVPNLSSPLDGIQIITELDDIKDEIRYLVTIDMTNFQLNPSEEKIVKKLFRRSYCHTLEYKQIGGGFSSSKVFEVTPYKFAKRNTKYVVKINRLESEKLRSEAENFYRWVEDVDRHYSINEEHTEMYRAIKYNYASGDGLAESQSLASRLGGHIPFNNDSRDEIIEVVKRLFNLRLFEEWNDGRTVIELNAVDAYAPYIDPDAICEKIALINNQTFIEARDHPVMQIYHETQEKKIRTFEKVCHGDLHTENVFIDAKNLVFLIDFGDTGKHHSPIDQAALECSIKFRHIPRYIPIGQMIEVERELLHNASFFDDYAIQANVRDDVKAYFGLIQQIRLLSKKCLLDPENQLEYLVSLFMMTLRQIRYNDLNQLYALKSAEIVGAELANRMGITY